MDLTCNLGDVIVHVVGYAWQGGVLQSSYVFHPWPTRPSRGLTWTFGFQVVGRFGVDVKQGSIECSYSEKWAAPGIIAQKYTCRKPCIRANTYKFTSHMYTYKSHIG